MSSESLRLSRSELVEFLPSQRAVKAFEAISNTTQTIINNGTIEISADAEARIKALEDQSLQVMAWLAL